MHSDWLKFENFLRNHLEDYIMIEEEFSFDGYLLLHVSKIKDGRHSRRGRTLFI